VTTKLQALLDLGKTELGKPYSYGAEGPNMFDCSGLMQFLFGAVGISLPRTSQAQQQAATPVASPVPGDLVFYGSPATHVALYVGSGQQLAAPHSGDVVKIQPVSSGATYGRVAGLGNTTTAPLAGIAQTVGLAGSGAVGSVLDSVKPLVFEATFVVLGLGLIGYGVYRAVGRKGK
jgi:hypothetical protein